MSNSQSFDPILENPKRIILWTYPRTVSTAFERSFMRRPDTKTFHEPYGNAYYFGPERILEQPGEGDSQATFSSITEQFLAPCNKDILFSKDMAYYVSSQIQKLPLNRWINTFLIRDPRKAFTSYFKTAAKIENWKFNPEELGLKQLYELFCHVTQDLSQPAIVIDADDLVSNPSSIVSQYCQKVGIEMREEMLSWDSVQSLDEFKSWSGWHDDALKSSGFEKRSRPQETFPELEPWIKEYSPLYQKMYQYRIAVA